MQVQQATGEAVETLRKVMQAADAPASARVSAAKTIFETAVKAVELEDLEARIVALETARRDCMRMMRLVDTGRPPGKPPPTMDESPQSVVVWLGPDGVPEDLPEHLTGSVRVIYLPRKSASPEAWVHECALRRQRLPEEAPPYAPSL